MPTITQRALFRPIMFTLMDTGGSGLGALPLPWLCYPRPEELTYIDPSRCTVHQTLGGAWVDGFGAGLTQIQISGNTGWGQGSNPPGELQFHLAYNVMYKQWHQKRLNAVMAGKDPDTVKLILVDTLNFYYGVCVPMAFTLKRSRSRPLLYLYNINLIMVGNTISSISSKAGGLLDKVGSAIGGAISDISSGISDSLEGLADTVMGSSGGSVVSGAASSTSSLSLGTGWADGVDFSSVASSSGGGGGSWQSSLQSSVTVVK